MQELDYSTCTCKEDLEDIVFEHCKENGMNPIDLCTIPMNGSRIKAGCKVTVRDEDYDRALTLDFWPRGAIVRPWENRPRKRKQADDGRYSSE